MHRPLVRSLVRIRDAFQRISSGQIVSLESRSELQEILEGSPAAYLVTNPFDAPPAVDSPPGTPANRSFLDPLSGFGPHELSVYAVSDSPAKSPETGRVHSHPGEQVILQTGGAAEVVLQRFGSSPGDFRTKCIRLSANRGGDSDRVWFRGALPHHVRATGEMNSSRLVFFSEEQSVSAEHTCVAGTDNGNFDSDHKVLLFSRAEFWPAFSRAGSLVKKTRIDRRSAVSEVAQFIQRDDSWISRFERDKTAPTLYDLTGLAKALRIPVLDLLPDVIGDYVLGCYRVRMNSASLGGDWADSDRIFRLNMPFVWSDHDDLLVWLHASAGARLLTPLTVHIGSRSDWSMQCKEIGLRNQYRLERNTGLRRFGREAMLYAEQGSIQVAVGNLPWSELQPDVAHKFNDTCISREPNDLVNIHTIEAGQLLYVRSGYYPMRILPCVSGGAKVFCVIRRALGAGAGLRLPYIDEQASLIQTKSEEYLIPQHTNVDDDASIQVKSMRDLSLTSDSIHVTERHMNDIDENELDELVGILEPGAAEADADIQELWKELSAIDTRLPDPFTAEEIQYLAAVAQGTIAQLHVTYSDEEITAIQRKFARRQAARPVPPDIALLNEIINKNINRR